MTKTHISAAAIAAFSEELRVFQMNTINCDAFRQNLLDVTAAAVLTSGTSDCGEDITRIDFCGVIILFEEGNTDVTTKVTIFADNKNFTPTDLIRQLTVVGRLLNRYGVFQNPNCLKHVRKDNCWLIQAWHEFFDLALCKMVSVADIYDLDFKDQDYYVLVVDQPRRIEERTMYLIPTRDAEFI